VKAGVVASLLRTLVIALALCAQACGARGSLSATSAEADASVESDAALVTDASTAADQAGGDGSGDGAAPGDGPGSACTGQGTGCDAGRCAPCGAVAGQACCPGDLCDGGNLECQVSFGGKSCVTCGVPGSPCCGGLRCDADGCCYSGLCKANGAACANTGTDGGTCASGRCSGCGSLDQPCCDGTCLSGLDCQFANGGATTCLPCGGDGQPCCPGNLCSAPLCCDANQCVVEIMACGRGVDAGGCGEGG
jgi:hypothetical protein